jgi:arylsulfatase A-like enzyme/Tfp pilus assembly protein PilF
MKSLRALLIVALMTFPCTAMAERKEPVLPNVLLVTLDTTRADHLGCYGAGFAATLNLDALASAGVRFDEAISPAPLTLPSHASLFTGLIPRRHGVRDNTLHRLGKDPAVLAEVLRSHGYETAAFVSSVVLDRVTGIDRGFEGYDDTVRIGVREAFDYRERAAAQTNEAALAGLGELDEPFLLWVHYFDPHLPYVPPEPFRSRFVDRPYDGEVAYMDEQFGELLGAVRRKSSSLVVIVAGDHGESLGDHGELSHGVFIYQSTQRIPLLIAGPGVPKGRVVRERVGLVDVTPTLLDLLGLPALPDIDGVSLAPLMRGEDAPARDYELESFYATHAYGWVPPRALVRGDEKFILLPRTELYRLDQDPAEKKNLAAARPRRASELEEALSALIAGDEGVSPAEDPELVEQQRRLESIGYVGGHSTGVGSGAIDPKDGIDWIADLDAGRRAYQTGRPADGIEPLRRLLSRNPENVPALLALAMCYLGSGRVESAVETDRRALAIAPDDDLVHFNLANALAIQGRSSPAALAEARTHYERAVRLNPRFADAYLNYASLLERAESDGAALALLERARSAGVRDPELETRVGVFELKRGDVEAAKQALRRGLELNPRAEGPLEAMATIAQRQERYEEAVHYLERLLEVHPSARIAFTLGSIRLDRLGDRVAAKVAFEQALALSSPDDPVRATIEERIERLSGPP